MSKEEAKSFRSTLYTVDPSRGFIKPRNKQCPRCGSMMGYYKPGGERWYCGKCHYTEFIRK